MSDLPPIVQKYGVDTTDFKTGVAAMNRELRALESGFRAAAARLGDWSRDASGLELRLKSLNSKIEVQKDKVAATRAEYERLKAEKGENSVAAKNLEIKLNREIETLGKMEYELGQTETALAEMGAESQQAGEGVEELGRREEEAARSSGKLREALNKLKAGVKKVGGGLRNLGQKVLKGLATAFAAVVAGVGAAAAAIGVGFKKAVGAASELNEAVNASSTVFGESADVIQEFGRTAADTAGLAAAEFNQMAAVTGAMLQNYGQSAAEAADETITLAQRAADMASIFNTDVSDAMGAINALLRGEADPIERYGVSINQAAVNAKALELGLADASGEISKQAQLTARLALFYEQTDKIAGDFVKTSEQEANARRVAAARWQNFLATIGGIGLPIMNKFWSTIAGKILPVLNSFAEYIKLVVEDGDFLNDFLGEIPERFRPIVQSIGEVIAAFKEGGLRGGFERIFGADFVAKVLEISGAIKSFVTETLIPFIQEHAEALKGALIGIGAVLAVAGIVALGAALASLVNPIGLIVAAAALLGAAWAENWGGIREKTQAVWEAVHPVLQTIWEWLKVNVPAALEKLRAFWVETAWPAIQRTVQTVWPVIEGIFSALKDFILNTLIPTVTDLYTKWTTVWWPTIQTVLENVWTIISAIFEELGRWINDNIIPWVEYLQEVWAESVWPAIQTAVEDVWAVIQPIWEGLLGWLEEKLPPALDGLQSAFETVMTAIDGAISPVKELWDKFYGAVKSFWEWIKNKTFSFKIKIPDLPDWAVPGSPLPIHTAWKRFAEDMQRMTIRPNLQFEAVNYGLAGTSAGGAPAQNTTKIFLYGDIVLQGVQDRESLLEELQNLAT